MAWGGTNQGSSPHGGFDYFGNSLTANNEFLKRQGDPSNPSTYAQDYLRPGFNMAQSYLAQGTGFTPYQGNRVAGFNPTQQQYFDQTSQTFGSTPGYQAAAANTVNNVATNNGVAAGAGQSMDTLRSIGQDSGTNPYFQQQLNNQLDDIQNRVNAMTSGAGRYGSASHAGTLTKSLGDVATNALSNQYQFDRNLQMNALNSDIAARQASQQDALRAAALSPSIMQGDIQRLSALAQSGALQQAQSQDEINAARDLYSETQNAPWERLNAYMGAIQGGGSYAPQQQQSQSKPSTAQSILGGALTGASLGSNFGPWGTAIGGIGGGLMGLF